MTKSRLLVFLFAILVVAGAGALAQRYYGGFDRGNVPDWQPDKEFSHDVFTFVRIQYSSGYGGRVAAADAGTDAATVPAEAVGRRTIPTAT